MPALYGFGIGDVIAGIGVIKTLIGAFSHNRGAKQGHTALYEVLTRLCESLETVRKIKTDTAHDSQQQEAVRQDVEQCYICIDGFIDKIAKHKGMQVTPELWKNKLKKAVRKIQWALCEEADSTKFKSDIQLQLDSIIFLLVSLQIRREKRETSLEDQHRQQTSSLLKQQASTIETIIFGQKETLNVFLEQMHLASSCSIGLSKQL